jgi:hypothetical protein
MIMKKHTNTRRVRKAKGSLEKMMEMLRPYLPKKQTVVPEMTQKWRLTEDNYGSRKKKRNPAAL